MGKADDKYIIEIDYIESGFDAVIKNGKKIQKLSSEGAGKRFSQFQQGGVTAQNRNEALARAKASKAAEKAAKATTRSAQITQKTTPTAATAPFMGTLAGSLGRGGAAANPLIPSQPFPSQNLRRGNIATLNRKSMGFTPGASRLNPIPTLGKENKYPQQQKKSVALEGKHSQLLKKANMSLFKMQMASLGVYFSFMSITMALTGLFTGLQNLGGVFKSGALGKAFGGVDVTGAMGVDPATLVQGWKNITGIMGMMQSAISGLAASALTPEVMKAIQEMFLSLGKSLSDGKVAKALGDIIISFTDMVEAIVNSGLLTKLAELISFLGDTGLLVPIIGLILGSQYLLAALSSLGFVMQGVTLITGIYNWAIKLTGASIAGALVSFAWFIVVAAAVLIIVGFLVNLFENFQKTGWSVQTVINALIDTFADLYNTIAGFVNSISSALGRGNVMGSYQTVGTSTAGYTQINYNFAGNYDDPSALIKKAQQAKNTSY